MNRGGRLLLVVALAACGGADQRSASAPADTSRTPAIDTLKPAVNDTAAPPVQDTGATGVAPESAVTKRDTTRAVAAKPAQRKPSPRPAAPVRSPAVDTAAPAEASATAADTTSPAGTSQTDATDTATVAAHTSDTAPAANPTTQASAPLRDQYHPAPLDTVSQQVYDGWKQYNLNCARCHGEDVMGTTIAPHLLVSLKPGGPVNAKELFVQTVCAGRPAKGMPAWCPLGMEMSTIEEIYAYVKGRSDGKLRPGRPARREGG
jgi:hypothetical protein